MLGIELHERSGIGLTGHHEAEVLVQEHRHQQRRGVIRIDRAVVNKLTDAAALHHGVVIVLDQLGFLYQLTGVGVIPTQRGIILPL